MWRKVVKSVLFFLGLILLVGLICFVRMDFRHSDRRYEHILSGKGVAASFHYHATPEWMIRSVSTGDSSKTPLVFLHGTPGSSKDYQRYLSDTLLLKFSGMTAIDRPGYGYSDYGQVCISIVEQAELVAPLIPDSSVVVGHSFGGPVAAALAMYHPVKVKKLILLAPAVDPAHEKQFFINRIINMPAIRALLGGALQVAVQEKLSHVEALRAIENDWNHIRIPVVVVHGRKDGIVPFENVAFLKEKLVSCPTIFYEEEDMDHIMIWTDYEWVRDLLLQEIRDISAAPGSP